MCFEIEQGFIIKNTNKYKINPRKLVVVRDWKDTLTTVKSLRRLRGGSKKGKLAPESPVLFDDCQVNEVGFGHIVVWCFRLVEGSQRN